MGKPPELEGWRRWSLPVIVFGLVFAVYLHTTAPTVFGLDSAELTLGAYRLGIVHAPGYPVYLLVAHLFTMIPAGDIGFRVNFFSAVCGALLAASIATTLARLLEDRWHAGVAALAFAFVYYQWAVSIVAEVYAFQGLLFIGIILAALRWRERGSETSLLVCASLCGLSAANNPATSLWWPGIAFLILSSTTKWAIPRSSLVKAACAFALGLLPVVYLPLRSAADPHVVYAGSYNLQGDFIPLDLARPGNLIWYLSGGQFRGLFPGMDLRAWLDQSLVFVRHFGSAFLGVGVPLGLWGLWRMGRSDSQLLLGFALTIGPFLVFFVGYQAVDKEFMLLPFYIVWSLALGLGLEALFHALGRRWRGLGLLLPAALLIVNLPFVDTRAATTLRQIGMARLRAVEPEAYYLALWGDASIMQYLQDVEGIRQDVTVVNVFFVEEGDLPLLINTALNGGYNVYLTRRDLLEDGGENLQPVGHGYRYPSPEGRR
jgi:hypothetical protein